MSEERPHIFHFPTPEVSNLPVHDGVEAVRNGEHRAVGKPLADGRLDQRVCRRVHVCRSLVQHEDAAVAQDGASKAHELPLPHAEVRPRLAHVGLQPTGQLEGGGGGV